MPQKAVSAEDAMRLVRTGDVITTSGFVGIGVPDLLLAALEKRFLETGEPRDLTLLFAAGQGDGKTRGLNRLGHTGLLRRVIGGHWGLIPKLGALALAGDLEAYNLPQGVVSHLFRAIAAGQPGVITKVGLETFVDPRLGGGKINDRTVEDLVRLIEIETPGGAEEHLYYPSLPVNVALLRGTTADERGSITMEREALILDNLAQAMAVRNSGGVVIAQVERIAAANALNPREVVVPGALVDAVVVSEARHHRQTYKTDYSAAFAGLYRAAAGEVEDTPLDARKIIARRAAFELPVNGVVNLGIGMPEGVAAVAGEEGLLDHLTLTAEPGVIGGQPASGLDFGAAINTDAVIAQNQQFDFYDGGGLDLAVLGMAQAGRGGDVNVSRFGDRLAGAGGFINISQNAKAVVFAGTFTSGGLQVALSEGRLRIHQEGRASKFMETVEQVTFSGARAARLGQPVLYVTERCVFQLARDAEGAPILKLIEIAPGVDLEREVLALMSFRPAIEEVAEMDPRLFDDALMGLKRDLLFLDLEERIALDPESGVLFVNFENMRVRAPEDVAKIRDRVETICRPLGELVDVIVNYDGARIDEEIEPAYAAMVLDLEKRFYRVVTRYSGSAFMRMKLDRAFARSVGPHIYESREEAQRFLKR